VGKHSNIVAKEKRRVEIIGGQVKAPIRGRDQLHALFGRQIAAPAVRGGGAVKGGNVRGPMAQQLLFIGGIQTS